MKTRSLILPPDFSPGHNWLLVIGIDQYTSGIPVLHNAVQDAKAVADVLTEGYGFEPQRQTRLFDAAATYKAVFQALQRLRDSVGPNDNVVIYFAGHGWFNRADKIGYLIPVDAVKGEEHTYLSNSVFLERVGAIKCQHLFVIADSCFSGSLLRSGAGLGGERRLEKLIAAPSRRMLTAGRIEEVADGFHGNHSPFAQAVLRYLRTEAPEAFAVSDLAYYVSQQVPKEADQVPHEGVLFKTGDLDGAMVLLKVRSTDSAWEATRKEDTVLAYTRFLREYPDSSFAAAAKDRRHQLEEEAAWKDAKRRDTLSAYDDYMERFPDGQYADEARTRAEARIRETERQEREEARRREAAREAEERRQRQADERARREREADREQQRREDAAREADERAQRERYTQSQAEQPFREAASTAKPLASKGMLNRKNRFWLLIAGFIAILIAFLGSENMQASLIGTSLYGKNIHDKVFREAQQAYDVGNFYHTFPAYYEYRNLPDFDAESQRRLGMHYLNGWGTAVDSAQAQVWLQKAANAGILIAKGQLYGAGLGVVKDEAQAVKWYSEAAEQGDANAQNSLGFMYDKGKGVAQNYAKAVEWYSKAAEQGFAIAQNNLGLMYEDSRGVLINIDAAIRWYKLAAAQGNENAIANLKRLGITSW